MTHPRRPEPIQIVKERRDAALKALVDGIPYARFLGISFDRRGDELTAVLHYDDKLIGNPFLPALHGGVTSAFLEIAGMVELAWSLLWEEMKAGRLDPRALDPKHLPRLPKTIDLSVDYLRTGLPREAYARARVVRSGRRYASVLIETWQDNRARPFALAMAHFLIPARDAPAAG